MTDGTGERNVLNGDEVSDEVMGKDEISNTIERPAGHNRIPPTPPPSLPSSTTEPPPAPAIQV